MIRLTDHAIAQPKLGLEIEMVVAHQELADTLQALQAA